MFFCSLFFLERGECHHQRAVQHPPGQGRCLPGQPEVRIPEQAVGGPAAERLAEAEVPGPGGLPRDLPRGRVQAADPGQSADLPDEGRRRRGGQQQALLRRRQLQPNLPLPGEFFRQNCVR